MPAWPPQRRFPPLSVSRPSSSKVFSSQSASSSRYYLPQPFPLHLAACKELAFIFIASKLSSPASRYRFRSFFADALTSRCPPSPFACPLPRCLLPQLISTPALSFKQLQGSQSTPRPHRILTALPATPYPQPTKRPACPSLAFSSRFCSVQTSVTGASAGSIDPGSLPVTDPLELQPLRCDCDVQPPPSPRRLTCPASRHFLHSPSPRLSRLYSLPSHLQIT